MPLYVSQGKRITRRHVGMTLLLALNIIVSHFAAIWLRLGWEGSAGKPYDWNAGLLWLQQNWLALVVSILVYALVFYAGGMYEPSVRRRRGTVDPLPFATTAISAALVGLFFYTGSSERARMGRGLWALASFLTLIFSYLIRAFQLALIERGHFRRRAIVLADSDKAVADARLLMRRALLPLYHVLGVIRIDAPDVPPAPDSPPPPLPDVRNPDAPWPLLGPLSSLESIVQQYGAVAILVEVGRDYPTAILPRLRHLRYAGLAVLDHVALSEQLAHEIPLSHINEQWLMTAALNSAVPQIHHLKRLMDILLCLLAIPLALPLVLLGMALVKLTSAGPALYRQTRVGLGGSTFTLVKLRTMRIDAEASGAVWAASNDSRVTPVGRFLRTFRIDEIPQIWNILRGDMSWIGPRPERPEFTRQLASLIPFYEERHLVRPGLTGWAQVCYPYGASVEAAARKLQYELYYIKNMTVLLDLSILLRTCKTILVGLAHEDDNPAPDPDAIPLADLLTPPADAANAAPANDDAK
ncbi:MAG: exopolysaccharide biosynthesis polyprenyl glycosylphosphotransferase [Kiritimatiellae bacterium]|nr:exopolysaccharide biosynthesis polyprenyl glycosylphosphotransferase [Kiritimatiellia bacterium]